MASSDKTPPAVASKTPAGKKPPEMTVEQRMLLAFVLMGLVLFGTQFFLKPQGPTDTVKSTQPASASQAKAPVAERAEAPAPAKAAAAKPAAGSASAGPMIAAPTERPIVVDTDLYRIQFSNRGASVRSWQLKKYRDGAGKPLELVNPMAAGKAPYPFTFEWESAKPSIDLNQALFVPTVADNGRRIDFAYANGRIAASKSFQFDQNSYMTDLSSSATENGSPLAHSLTWRGGFGDLSVAATSVTQRSLFFDVGGNKIVRNEAKAASGGPVSSTGSFGGIEDTFFAAIYLPKNSDSVKVQTFSDYAAVEKGGKEEPRVGAALGGAGANTFSLFVGPKDLDLLRRVNPKLPQLIDFGWFAILARPLFLALNWVHDNWVHNYGWTIILVTVAINFLLLPLKLTSMKSMKKMSALQPQIAAINDKYKDVKISDPRKAQQNQEVMDLYKKHGVNPAGGCVPLLIQIPFFYAYYTVLSVAIELRGAPWLWVRDLSTFDPLYVLPILMVVSQFVVTKMTPATSMDPAQQRMMLFMPLMLGFFFIKAQSGLVLYWLTGNLVGLIQQWFINRTGGTPAAAVIDVKPVASGKRTAGRK